MTSPVGAFFSAPKRRQRKKNPQFILLLMLSDKELRARALAQNAAMMARIQTSYPAHKPRPSDLKEDASEPLPVADKKSRAQRKKENKLNAHKNQHKFNPKNLTKLQWAEQELKDAEREYELVRKEKAQYDLTSRGWKGADSFSFQDRINQAVAYRDKAKEFYQIALYEERSRVIKKNASNQQQQQHPTPTERREKARVKAAVSFFAGTDTRFGAAGPIVKARCRMDPVFDYQTLRIVLRMSGLTRDTLILQVI